MTVETGHQAGPAGCGKRVLHEGLPKQHALCSQSVDVRCRCQASQGVAIGTNGLIGMIIRHDVDDVERFLGGWLLAACTGTKPQCGCHEGKGRNVLSHDIVVIKLVAKIAKKAAIAAFLEYLSFIAVWLHTFAAKHLPRKAGGGCSPSPSSCGSHRGAAPTYLYHHDL